MESIEIGNNRVGEKEPAFVIAEAGVNHNGSTDLAKRLIDAAADAGCDVVKFQKRTVRALLAREAYERPYENGGHSYGRTYGEHRERVELTPDDYWILKEHARERGIAFMASVWDHASADFIDSLGVPAHKIGSPDLTNLPLCRHVASFGKPVILSTGMSRLWEVDAAVREIRAVNPKLIVLHCVSIYPAPWERIRLSCIETLRARYGLPVGYSGHEPGWHAVIAAVALGARVIEKHITLDRSMKGGDHRFSLEPAELRTMVQQIRETEASLNGSVKELLPEEEPFRCKLAKSITTRVAVRKGTILTPEMLTCKSPATGVPPTMLERLIGKTVIRDIAPDTILRSEDVRL